MLICVPAGAQAVVEKSFANTAARLSQSDDATVETLDAADIR
jgi:hypothetical protein